MARHPLARLETVALVAIGGFAGANLRFLVAGFLPETVAVLVVNVVGSFLLGFLVYEARYTGIVDPTARVVFTTGVLSSLTTYSTFALQAALAARPLGVAAVVTGNYGLGFAGVLVGRTVAAAVRNRRARA
ncbi:CrcB family protein [Saliphagus sp. LR7]|uniref:fluoride efflux transporter FluC n=1 Tax=Saliphagus sp. LR7 TaxID=2282654 RepID=UPI000DF8038C|nr:CrcB family protein [Saliphagus sp. LR7]